MVKKLLATLTLLPTLLIAAELPQELIMPTDVGRVAITIKECPVKNRHGFEFEAYALELKNGESFVHPGCWTKKGDIVYIWFYEEVEPIVASYKDYHFKPAESM
jgi:hypothetical protein